jgi:hypothetical protein
MEPSKLPALTARRRSVRRLRLRRERPTQRAVLLLACGVMIAGTALSIANNNNQVKTAGVTVIVIVLASLILSLRGMLVLGAVVAGCFASAFKVHGFNTSQLSVTGFVMICMVLGVAVVQTHRRDRLGLRQVSAEKVIGLIRDRLLVQAALPEVPDGWNVDIQQRPADGAAISGDFVSARLVSDQSSRVLHLAVIDVSGSGIAAGPRALLLSGAVGGLIGSVPPDEFLVAANDYLSRQQWSLGFASAIYVRLELSTGRYEVRVAGHPPALHYRPGQQPRWRTSAATGTVLGVLPTLTCDADFAELLPGESLYLYTDGVVEDRKRDLDAGTRRLTDAVERFLDDPADSADQDNFGRIEPRDKSGIAAYLVDEVPADRGDDRTVVVISRDRLPVDKKPVADRAAELRGS